MKICVTGGAGFIGSHLVDALLQRGDEVVVVDNLSTGHLSNLKPVLDQIHFYEGDCADTSLMSQALEGVDAVLHQAALTSVPRSIGDPLQTHAQTMTAMVVTLELARLAGATRFVYAASSSTYGDQDVSPKHEGLFPMPKSPYAAAKTACEFYAAAWSRCFDLTTIGLRYFNVFGPRQDPDSQYAAVIPRFIKRLKSNQAPVITGDGDQSRDFTYIDNVVHANLCALEAKNPIPGCVVNVACGKQVTLPELVTQLNNMAGTDIKPTYAPSRPGDVRHSLADISAANKQIGYTPQVSFTEGLQRTWDATP